MKLDDDWHKDDLVKVLISNEYCKEGKEYKIYFSPLKAHTNIALYNIKDNKKGWFLIDKKLVEKVVD